MNEQRTTADRLAAFCDAVMAVIITIMVLELEAPEGSTFESLLPLWPTAIGYAVGYLFIAIIWVNYHHLLRFEREVLAQADLSMMPDKARRLARRRSFAALAILAAATLTSPFAPLLGLGLICCALVLYLRPEALSDGAA